MHWGGERKWGFGTSASPSPRPSLPPSAQWGVLSPKKKLRLNSFSLGHRPKPKVTLALQHT